MNCIICGQDLIQHGPGPKKTKYCSSSCKSRFHKRNNYKAQQTRGVERKIKLLKIKGGQCVECGYNKNLAALQFHHRNPNNKNFCLDIRNCSNRKWETLLKESEKCDVLCANCHSELHNPEGNYWNK